MYLYIVNKHAPFREKRVKRANQPKWINDEILEKNIPERLFKRIWE